MKKLLLVLVGLVFVLNFLPVQSACAADIHKLWKNQKKHAEKLFKSSEKKKMKKYVKFNKGFGPTLTKLQKAKAKGKKTAKLKKKALKTVNTYIKRVHGIECGKKDASCQRAQKDLGMMLKQIEQKLKADDF